MIWKIRRVHVEWRFVHEDALSPHSFPPPVKACRDDAARWRQWLRDPLSHPDLEVMSLTQLADLPFDPRRFSRE